MGWTHNGDVDDQNDDLDDDSDDEDDDGCGIKYDSSNRRNCVVAQAGLHRHTLLRLQVCYLQHGSRKYK